MTMILGHLLIAAFGIAGVVAPAGHSLMCLQCHGLADPRDCSKLEHCGHHEHDQICYTEAIKHGDHVTFTQGCKARHECDALNHIGVGKRYIACLHCCEHTGCNKDLCLNQLPTTPPRTTPTTTMRPTTTTTTTTMAPTTTTTMAPPTTTLAACRDHEEDGFSCSDYDQYNFCTDTTGIAHEIAVNKCSKHCGFCGGVDVTVEQMTTTPAINTVTATTDSTSSAPCVDREDDTFSCLDKLDLCVDNSYYAMLLAKDRCPKFCGLCTDNTDTDGGSIIV